MQIDVQRLDRALDKLLLTAFDGSVWKQTLEEIQAAVGGVGANILPVTNRVPGPCPHTDSVGEGLKAYFDDNWHMNDYRQLGLNRLLKEGYFLDQDIVDFDGFNKNPYYKFLKKYNLGWSSVTGFQANEGFMAFVLHRDTRRGPFERDEGDLLLRMRDRLSISSAIARHSASAHATGVVDAFNSMNVACVLFDRFGRITRCNAKAETLFESDLTNARGEISVKSSTETANLRGRIRDAIQSSLILSSDCIRPVTISRSGKLPLLVRVQRLTSEFLDLFAQSVAIAVIVDPDQQLKPDKSYMRALFGLTQAEADVAVEIAEGRNLREIAASRNVSYETIRTHVRACLSKTGTSQQSELAAVIGKMPKK